MIQELIYTSAQSGLKPGSRGYCTVASSAGMSKPMSEKLESLSGYRHLFPPGTIQADNNPVAYSYVRTQIGGQAAFVLSRIADAGLDYSGRSNKLAHHVVLEQADLVPAGPAACLAKPGFAAKNWSGEPRVLPPRATPELPSLEPMDRQSWKAAASDPMWCDFLVHQVRKRKPVYVVYPLEVDVLALMLEAQSLLPEDERWKMTFSTYFTRIPPGVECLVRCVPAGTKEAKTILGRHDQPKIDLSNPTPAPEVTPIAEVSARSSVEPTSAEDELLADSAVRDTEDFGDVRVAPPELPSESGGPRIRTKKQGRRRRGIPIWLPIVFGAILGGGIFAFVINRDKTPEPQQTAQTSETPVEETTTIPEQPSEASPELTSEATPVTSEAEAETKEAPSTTPESTQPTEPTPQVPVEESAQASTETTPPANPAPPVAETPAAKSRKVVHWVLGEEPKAPVLAKQIGDIQVRPLTMACKIEAPISEGKEWLVKGEDDNGFVDEVYFSVSIDPASQSLRIAPATGEPNPKLAGHTFSISIDDDREVFVHSSPTRVSQVFKFDGMSAHATNLKDVVFPPPSTIHCAAQVTVNNKVTKSTPQLQTDPLSAWIKISDEYAYLMEINIKKRAASLEPYAIHGTPKKPMRLADLKKLQAKTKPLQMGINDCDDMLKELKTIFETQKKPDLKKEFSEKQQKMIREAAQQIRRDVGLIEKGEKQFKIRKYFGQAGKAAGQVLLRLADPQEDLSKLKESTIAPLKTFEAFLKQTKKDWLADSNYDRKVMETLTKVEKLSDIKLDVVLYKSKESGGRFPFLRFTTTDQEEAE